MVSFALAGCSGTPSEKDITPSPSSSETAAILDTKTTYGDVHAYKIVEDADGKYAATTINEDAKALQYDASIVDSSTTGAFTQEEIITAQKIVATFVAEETLDSIALDSTAGWEEWKANVAPQKFYPNSLASVLSNETYADNYDRSLVIENNSNNETPKMVRDGKPRSKNTLINLTKVFGGYDPNFNQNYLQFNFNLKATYRISEEETLRLFKEANPDMSVEEMKKTNPLLFDGVEGKLFISLPINYTFVKDANNNIVLSGFDSKGTTKKLNYS
jgi:hypothetical protein